MHNQWGRQMRREMSQNSGAIVLGIVIIIILGYLLFSNFFKNSYSRINPSFSAANVNLPSTYDSTALNSSGYPFQNSPDIYNPYIRSANNDVATGYWILFDASGTIKQFSVSTQDYVFLQRLITSDSKGTPTITIFLVDNGRIQKYVVSNEIFLIITNMANIQTRSPNSSSYSSSNTPSSLDPNSPPYSSPNASSSLSPNSPSSSSPNSSSYSSPNIVR